MEEQKQNNLKVIEFIGEIIAGPEFQEAQSQFFDQNCHHFENEDENKHEYNDLFKEYTSILEQSVEAKLEQNFSENQISTFFEDFEQNYKNYPNQNTVETLFTFTDFSKFKQTMLEYNLRKQGKFQEKEQDDIQIEKAGQDINFSIFDEYKNKDLSQWNLAVKGKGKDDFTIHTIPYGKTGIDLARGQFILKGIRAQAVINAVINTDYEQLKKENSQIKDAKVIKEYSPTNKIVYIRVKLPLMTDRDFINQIGYKFEGKKCTIYTGSVDFGDMPEQKGCIRAENQKVIWVEPIENTNDTKIYSIEYSNLKGYVPKMFMNMMMSKMGKKSIEDFTKKCQIEEEKLK